MWGSSNIRSASTKASKESLSSSGCRQINGKYSWRNSSTRPAIMSRAVIQKNANRTSQAPWPLRMAIIAPIASLLEPTAPCGKTLSSKQLAVGGRAPCPFGCCIAACASSHVSGIGTSSTSASFSCLKTTPPAEEAQQLADLSSCPGSPSKVHTRMG